ncbi:uncharacterized protein LOC114074296 [Solanum pennellii]|uniref:Uncharacterized protein LOC114074296 n=1 Tax=Solanum pennellii TaxID=28526 RepID=A0ABM1UWT9_SOLPN|nr:uncharacterized protein LOC114074296 [Solanum pennellii]
MDARFYNLYELREVPNKIKKLHIDGKVSRHVPRSESLKVCCSNEEEVDGHNECFVVIKRRFQHSLQTIHKYFHEVLEAMMKFAKEMISSTSSNLNSNILSGALGALDGTLVHAVVPTNKQLMYRGRGKGKCYQNVLGICDFNMIFTYVYGGWDGVTYDTRVLKEIVSNSDNGFPFPPPHKYYICDAAYPNARGFLAHYRNV